MKFRILIVGHGSIGKRHLRIARELLPTSKILVMRHQPTQVIPELADYVTASLDDAISFKPHIAIIATPAPFHLETAKILAESNCHLLIEKPIAAQSHGLKEFLAYAHQSQLVCQVGYNLRFLPSLAEYRRLIRSGAIGQPLSIHCEMGQYLPDWRPGTNYRQGVSARKELGGGVILELSHELDYLYWIFGPVNWVSAWAGQLSDLEIDVEDSAFLTLGFASTKAGRETVASVNLDFVRRDTTRTCLVIGSTGSLRWNGLAGTVEEYREVCAGWETVFSQYQEQDESYRNQFDQFLSCIKSGQSPLVDGDAGLAVLQIIEAAKQSIDLGGLRQKVVKIQRRKG